MALSVGIEVSSSLATSLVAWVQISMSSWRRSSSVIRPRSYWVCTLAALASYVSRKFALGGGVMTSEIATVVPDRVAQEKHMSLCASSEAARWALVYREARSMTM